MHRPIQIRHRNVPKSEALDELVRRKVEGLERAGRVHACLVVIEAPRRPSAGGKRYFVTLSIRVPGGEIVVHEGPASHKGHDEVEVAIAHAFDAAKRRLQEQGVRRREARRRDREWIDSTAA